MDIIIVQQAQNVPNGRVLESDLSHVDNQQSQIETTPVMVTSQKLELLLGEPELAKDKTVIGYTSQGLPFLLTAHRWDASPNAAFDFIDQFVIPQMYALAQQLSVSVTPMDVIRTFIGKIDSARSAQASIAEFTLAIAIIYEKADGLRCAGFSIGDLGIVKQNAQGIIEQIAFGSEMSNAQKTWVPDRFCTREKNAPDLATIVNRNCIFSNIPVEPGCELCSYTFLFPELLVALESVDDQSIQSRRLNVKVDIIKEESKCLFGGLKRASQKCLTLRKEEQDTSITRQDAMFGRVIVPDSELRMQLAREIAIQEFTTLQEMTIDDVKDKVNAVRLDVINAIASSQLRIRLPKAHGFTLFSTGIAVLCHHERATYLISAMRQAPTLSACSRIVDHQLTFYDPECELPRPPLPAWLDPNVKDRLEQGFNRPAVKGIRGYFALLELLKNILTGKGPKVAKTKESQQETVFVMN